MSPAVTPRAVSNASDPMNVPAVDASQNDTCEYVSVADTDVHVHAADVVIDPLAAAENVPSCLVVFEAAFDVPAAPGSPVCSFTHSSAGSVHATLRAYASRMLFAIPDASPTAISCLLRWSYRRNLGCAVRRLAKV